MRGSVLGLALAAGMGLLLWMLLAPPTPVTGRDVIGVPAWIDTDPAVGLANRDVDDGFALVQAFASPSLAIRGVSTVFGNASLNEGWPITQFMVQRFGPSGLRAYRGAAGPGDLGRETHASRALAAALEQEPLTLLVLGPATNVATVLKNHPELAVQVREVVAVAGRRPGQRFTTGTVNPAAHRDFNFEQDPEAFAVLLASGVPITLAPFEVSSKVWVTRDDLARLDTGGPAARYLAGPARGWLALWEDVFAVDGFNPFDTLAVATVTMPGTVACDILPAAIVRGPDDNTEARMQGTQVPEKPYLVVSSDLASGTRVRYCHTASPEFKPRMLDRLLAYAP